MGKFLVQFSKNMIFWVIMVGLSELWAWCCSHEPMVNTLLNVLAAIHMAASTEQQQNNSMLVTRAKHNQIIWDGLTFSNIMTQW